MSKPIIAVDVDEVLADGAESFIRFSNSQWNTHLTIDDYQEHWSDMWHIDHDETERRAAIWNNSGAIAHHAATAASIEVLRHMKERYGLVVTTSRRRAQMPDTEEWLKRNYGDTFMAVHAAGIFDSGISQHVYTVTKADLFQTVGASYVIDDQPKHCFAAATLGLRAILFGDYAWNRYIVLPEGVTRCHDWLAVGEYFDAQ